MRTVLSTLFRVVYKVEPKFEPTAENKGFLEVRTSGIPNAGNGLFTTKAIKEGETICTCQGELLPWWKQYFVKNVDHVVFIRWGLSILPYTNDQVQMINHHTAEKPANVRFDRQPEHRKVTVKAIKGIAPDEELLITYHSFHLETIQWD